MANKRIALICNTYIRNYGSVLQSLATFIALKKLGFDVDVVNYKDYPSAKEKIEIFIRLKLPMIKDTSFILKKLRNKLSTLYDKDYSQIVNKRNDIFDDYVKKHFSFTKKCTNKEEVQSLVASYDAVIIGSDQLWGPADIIRDYHTLNFVPHSISKISYATSFGVSKLPTFLNKRTSYFLKRMDDISVREDSGANIIKTLTNIDVPVVVDPTLLLANLDWDNIIEKSTPRKIKSDYIFCFFLGDNKEQRDLSKMISKQMGLPIVSIQHMDEYVKGVEDFADINYNDASPSEFIELIKNAKLVLCDSFHASVFSIQYKKLFYTFNRYNPNSSNARNSRIETLLTRLGISQRHITNVKEIDVERLISATIDYDHVCKYLGDWKKRSYEYLTNSLYSIR